HLGVDRPTGQYVFCSQKLCGFAENAGAPVIKHQVTSGSYCWIGGQSRGGIRGAALGPEHEV
ncbi:unnamed protein product, partial [marine sediment metagenome]